MKKLILLLAVLAIGCAETPQEHINRLSMDIDGLVEQQLVITDSMRIVVDYKKRKDASNAEAKNWDKKYDSLRKLQTDLLKDENKKFKYYLSHITNKSARKSYKKSKKKRSKVSSEITYVLAAKIAALKKSPKFDELMTVEYGNIGDVIKIKARKIQSLAVEILTK